jgi:hypothetical protein
MRHLDEAKMAYLETEREAAMWSAFLESEPGRAVVAFFEKEYVDTFRDADTAKQAAADNARRVLIRKFFGEIRHAWNVRDVAARTLRDMLTSDEENPDRA